MRVGEMYRRTKIMNRVGEMLSAEMSPGDSCSVASGDSDESDSG